MKTPVTKISASREAIAEALELFHRHTRAGHICGLSLEWEPNTTARLSATYVDGADEVELPGIVPEDDEQ